MNANSALVLLTPLALSLANHLWQSTLVACVVGLLTLALRRNHPGTRYWLWMAASLKFLVPFSLLMILGGQLESLRQPPQTRQAAAVSFVAIEQFSEPFNDILYQAATQGSAVRSSEASVADRVATIWNRTPFVPIVLAAAWLTGFFVVTTRWVMRWRRISAAIQLTEPLRDGREFESLQRMASRAGIRQSFELRSLPASMEPGVFGLLRPVLLWPQAITGRLEDAHLEAVLAHEVCHVRRRDNLTAAIHMAVEAIFWFHPLVWWLETRLVEEREQACDEEVLQLCGKCGIYAESILRVCEFCVESPLACVSGITGADLKRRIVQILSEHRVLRLTTGKKLLLVAAGLLLAAVPIVVGQEKAAQRIKQGTQPAISAEDLTGSWQGTIALPNGNGGGPRVLIKVTREGAQGAPYKGTVHLLAPRAVGVPAILVHGSDVSFALPLLNGMTYAGTLSPDGKTMSGALKPPNGPGAGMPLNLTHVAEEDAWPMPEAPKMMAKDAHPKFEVVTVKPHPPNGRRQLGPDGREFKQLGYTVDAMIGLAYAMHVDQIIGAPDWFKTEEWDIEGIPDTPGHPNSPQSEDLTHDALATRFAMKFHYEQRELSAYVITIAKGGPKLQPTASGPDDDPMTGLGYGNAALHNMTIANFAKWFQTYVLDRPVIDRTALSGHYDFTLKWAPDESQFLQGRAAGSDPRPPLPDEIAAQPPIKDAMLQQLGLKMEVLKTMVQVMVIDHAEKPGAN